MTVNADFFLFHTLDCSKTIEQYVKENINFSSDTPLVVISHNDLQGNYGGYVSTNGFSVEDIENNCDLFFNGHLHNGMKITDKIINIGNLTGQNFSEDGFKYKHGVYIFDTDTMSYRFLKNPYAIYFYKVNLTDNKIKSKIDRLFSADVKEKAVSFTCYEEDYNKVKEIIANNNIQYSKIQVKRMLDKQEKTEEEEIEKIDHIQQFKNFVETNIGNDELTISELGYVL